jgi:hypothetical protein
MTLIEKMKATVAEWMTAKEAKTEATAEVAAETQETKVEVDMNAETEKPETEVKMEVAPADAPADVPAPDAMDARISELEKIVAALVDKVSAMSASDTAAQAMAAVEVLKTEFSATEKKVSEIAAQPEGKVAGTEKKTVKIAPAHKGLAQLIGSN